MAAKFYLKTGFLIPKTLRMKNLDYLKKGTLKAILKKNKRKKWKVARGQGWPCIKVAMQRKFLHGPLLEDHFCWNALRGTDI